MPLYEYTVGLVVHADDEESANRMASMVVEAANARARLWDMDAGMELLDDVEQVCDECGQVIGQAAPSGAQDDLLSDHHLESCSLHPANVAHAIGE